MSYGSCRFCGSTLQHVAADLGMSPLANSYLSQDQLGLMEPFYPLRALVCGRCFLVQLEEHESPAHIFTDYAYFSSYSTSWLAHAEEYVDAMVHRRGLTSHSMVVEVGSNDGYLLQYFKARGVPVHGIEPATNVAEAARRKGIPTLSTFFGSKTASELSRELEADLLIGNNVLAHVPDLNDFVLGLKMLLKPDGIITMEFPHLLRLLDERQFDTIYHEHFSYFSFSTVREVFAAHGLKIFDVEEIRTHGGSLRIYAAHANAQQPESERAEGLAKAERCRGLSSLERYLSFSEEVRAEKRAILRSFISWKEAGLSIVGYGAPAKGNTLLNHCGIGTDFIDFTVDRNPAKQGHFLPGSHIPIRDVAAISQHRPDLVIILPWNLRDEVMEQLSFIAEWGGRLVARTPELVVLE
ncbi:MAG: class I SAM-dependent methyltransferase [Actinomycetota bacterium]|nr:class I SAM-dependent methyltransferase [Actinomycetota bacterium]